MFCNICHKVSNLCQTLSENGNFSAFRANQKNKWQRFEDLIFGNNGSIYLLFWGNQYPGKLLLKRSIRALLKKIYETDLCAAFSNRCRSFVIIRPKKIILLFPEMRWREKSSPRRPKMDWKIYIYIIFNRFSRDILFSSLVSSCFLVYACFFVFWN